MNASHTIYQTGNPPRGRYHWALEYHWHRCTCSYCRDCSSLKSRIDPGLNRPEDPTGWSVYCISLVFVRFYLRWTKVKRHGRA